MTAVSTDGAAATDPQPGRRFLVIDDHPLFGEALSMTLASLVPGAEVRQARRIADALALLGKDPPPSLVLLDLALPDARGLDGLASVRAACPGVPVAVVSSNDDSRIIAAVLEAGAVAFVSKDAGRDEFERALAKIRAGERYTPPAYCPAETLAPAEDDADIAAGLAKLTPQQARILELVCDGKLNKQIAFELDIAESTVKAHMTAILRKLGVQSRTQAVLVANRHGGDPLLYIR